MQRLQILEAFLPLFFGAVIGTGNFGGGNFGGGGSAVPQPFVVQSQQPQQVQQRGLGLNALSDDQLWALVRTCAVPQYVFPWLCSTSSPPVKCTLPEFCYQGNTGDEYVCEPLPQECLDRLTPGGPKKNVAVIIQDPNDNSTIGTQDPNAFDNDPRCCDWARQRQCNENPFWMRQNCRHSCGTGEFVQSGTTYFTSKVAPECDPNKPQQTDSLPNCCQLARQGQCDSNPVFTRQNCKRSCGVQATTGQNNITLLTSNVIPECRGGSPGSAGSFGPPGAATAPLTIGGGGFPLNEIDGRNVIFGRRRKRNAF